MVQIVLIRPGSTDYDQQGRIQGTLDVPPDGSVDEMQPGDGSTTDRRPGR